jgi:hypothetical protein
MMVFVFCSYGAFKEGRMDGGNCKILDREVYPWFAYRLGSNSLLCIAGRYRFCGGSYQKVS